MSWGGIPGTKLNMLPETKGTGKSALQPYGQRQLVGVLKGGGCEAPPRCTCATQGGV